MVRAAKQADTREEMDEREEETTTAEAIADAVADADAEAEELRANANEESHAAAIVRKARRAQANEIALKAKYPRLVSVVERGPSGPTRVTIECDDPQTRLGVPVCVKTRTIAVQDLFQVHRCEPCQDRVVRRARRARTATRDKALRAAARAK